MDEQRLPGGWTLDEARANHPELIRAHLVWTRCEPPSGSWDHDHCVFCWVSIGGRGDGVDAAYTDDVAQPDDGATVPLGAGKLVGSPAGTRTWVCATCAEAYRSGFGWTTTGARADP
jgi:hypothetical protein